jgi:hypothetical protein
LKNKISLNELQIIKIITQVSFADSHPDCHFDADPDPAYYFDADPDPTGTIHFEPNPQH